MTLLERADYIANASRNVHGLVRWTRIRDRALAQLREAVDEAQMAMVDDQLAENGERFVKEMAGRG